MNLLIRETAVHLNRYIRQAELEFIQVIMLQQLTGSLRWTDVGSQLVCTSICHGLCDDFSQVRFAATFAARHYLNAINDSDREEHVWKQLLPRICLNRHYPADGVKSASHETWNMTTQGRGKALVTMHLKEAFEYYSSQVENKSHMICEAACWVLGELGTIIDIDSITPYIETIMQLLGVCLADESWQVRGAACVACSRIVAAHPNESYTIAIDIYLPLWLLHLNDHILSLRIDAAKAIGIAMQSSAESLASAALTAAIQYISTNLSVAAKPKKAFSFIPETSTLYSYIKKPLSAESVSSTTLPIQNTARTSSNAAFNKRFGSAELRRRPGSVMLMDIILLLDFIKFIY